MLATFWIIDVERLQMNVLKEYFCVHKKRGPESKLKCWTLDKLHYLFLSLHPAFVLNTPTSISSDSTCAHLGR